MEEPYRLIVESRRAIDRERKAIRKGGGPAAIPEYPGNVYVVEESDPRTVAAMIETGQWGIITAYTRGREELAAYWSLIRVDNPMGKQVLPYTKPVHNLPEYRSGTCNPAHRCKRL